MNKKIIYFLLVATLVMVGCKDEITIPTINSGLNIIKTTASTASISGIVKINSTAQVLQKGICWSIKVNPTTQDSLSTNCFSGDTVKYQINNLNSNTIYFVRPFVTDKNGTTYGDCIGFTTQKLATVTTDSLVTQITDTSAVITANVTSTGGEAVIERGVCYSKSPNPTIDSMKVISPYVMGVFSVQLTGLKLNTKYYVKSYVITDAGLSYGEEIVFTTQAYPSIVKDIDNNIYHTIKIGTQIWMVENLKTTKYNDGTSIPLITDGYSWYTSTTDGYCYYNNDSAYNLTYGAMYNWYAVASGKLAPKGWHIPSQAEYETLISYLGGSTVAGSHMKTSNSNIWPTTSNDAGDSGFDATAGGYRSSATGDYHNLKIFGAYWTSSESNNNGGRLLMSDTSTGANLDYDSKASGFSVRCIMDSI